MIVSDAIRAADALRPNTLDDLQKAQWVENLDLAVEDMMLDVRGLAEAVRNYSRGIYDKRMLAQLVQSGTITPSDYRAITGIPDTEEIVPRHREGHYPEDDWSLLLPEPYAEAYTLYLVSKIDYYNQETDLYQNDKAMYEAKWSEAQAWWRRENRPRSMCGWKV